MPRDVPDRYELFLRKLDHGPLPRLGTHAIIFVNEYFVKERQRSIFAGRSCSGEGGRQTLLQGSQPFQIG